MEQQFFGQFDPPVDKIISSCFDDDYIGTCIDIGATNGINENNSLHFELRGWKCLCFEPNPYYFEVLNKYRKNPYNIAVSNFDGEHDMHIINTGNGDNMASISALTLDNRLYDSHKHLIIKEETIKSKVLSLNTILKQHPDIEFVDFISIDTEGTELDVLKGIDLNVWKVPLLVVENNYEDKDIEDYLNNFGYTKIMRHVVNEFYMLKERI